MLFRIPSGISQVKLLRARRHSARIVGGDCMARLRGVLVTFLLLQLALTLSLGASAVDKAAPLVIGDTFTIDSSGY